MSWYCADCLKEMPLRQNGRCEKCDSNAIAPADRATHPDDREALREIAERFYVRQG